MNEWDENVTAGDVMIAMSRAGDGPGDRLPSPRSRSRGVEHGGRHERTRSRKGGAAVSAELATLAAELAGVLDHASAARLVAAAVRRVAGGAYGFVLAHRAGDGWEVEAADPLDAALDAGAVAALAARFDDGAGVRRWDAGKAAAGLPAGVGATLDEPGGVPRLAIALGVDAVSDDAGLDAVAAIGALGFRMVSARQARPATDRLVEAGLVLSAELHLDDVLDRLVAAARDVLGARYAALGVLNQQRTALAKFVTSGIDAAEHEAIGPLPTGRGLLGLLITDARPVRVDAIGDDPRSSGFPPNHPNMTTFLGVPIRVGTEVFGNLYVTEKIAGTFTAEDELVALTLAAQAAVAIGNAQRYGEQERAVLNAARARERAAEEGLRRAIEAQEAERARIARELHDEVGQDLTALALHLRALDDEVTSPTGVARLDAVRQALTDTSTNLRELAVELRPSGLREHGLPSAIERQAARLNETSGIVVDVAVGAIPTDLPDAVEIGLFRVVQEALTNVARHSGAANASVIANRRGGRLRVVVEDDGCGFDPSAPSERLGLAGISERVALLGGSLRIESDTAGGTTVIVELEVPDG
jgi:signal transduction histidine kinase